MKVIKRKVVRFLYFLIRRYIFLALLLFVFIPFVFYGALQSLNRTENRVEDWIPQSFEETRLLGRFNSVFGYDEILMITWEGCTLESSEVSEFRDKLLSPVRRGDEEVVYYRKVITGLDVFDQLRGDPLNLSRRDAIERMSGWLISPDGQTTCLIALISDAGTKYRREAVEYVWRVAAEVDGLDAASIHVAGSTMDSVAIDNASKADLVRLNIYSYSLCIIVSLICMHNLQATMIVFLLAIFNQYFCLALIYYFGIPFDSVLMLAVNLTFVLSVSFGMYIVSYYRQAMSVLPPQLAINRALRDTVGPTFIAVTTTVAALFSFMGSEMIPIRKFGFVSGVSILCASVIMVIFIGAHYSLFPSRQWRRYGVKKNSVDKSMFSGGVSGDTWIGNLLCRFLPFFALRYCWWIIFLTSILFFAGLFGVMRIKTYVGIQAMLSPESKPVQDYVWIEERIGPLIPVEIVLEMRGKGASEMMMNLRAVENLAELLRAKLHSGLTVISPRDFLSRVPADAGGWRNIARERVFTRLLYANRNELAASGYFAERDDVQYWRITVRNFASRNEDQGPFLDAVRSLVDGYIKSDLSSSGDVRLLDNYVCGGVPLVYRAQRQLLMDLQKSFLSAFILITVILAIFSRGVFRGVILMAPNVFPCVLIFGLLGFLGVRVEIGTMLTASAALGLSVDGTVHFIVCYREGLRNGLTCIEAITDGYRRCSTALVQTTAVCAFGLLVFSLSTFTPTVYFSLFMFSLLIVACLADLIILPAILIILPKNLFK
ncbi:MAG: MMPL family transporter [Planctomycetaceae bacterium]|jgi:predicted RND superfamily exporter protein|nr:MMPL family transporter [Planctomycetaceae bacterium]